MKHETLTQSEAGFYGHNYGLIVNSLGLMTYVSFISESSAPTTGSYLYYSMHAKLANGLRVW